MASDSTQRDETAKRLRTLRRKLARTSRRPQPPAPPSSGPDAIVYRRDVPRVEPDRVPEGGGICIPLERCVEGCEAEAACGLPFYLVERSLGELEPEAAILGEKMTAALAHLAQPRGRDAAAAPPLAPDAVTFLDLETTGLGCSPIFLIGTLVWRGRDLVARQMLARTYAEEAAILHHFAEASPRQPVFVTFNGKSFDLPYLRARAATTGAPLPEPRHHLDLLHPARRAYRHRLPDCRLQTLERWVCGRHRHADIPSHDIPRAYHDFVRTGDARELAQIVEHNLHDLVTLAHLALRLTEETARHP